MGTRVWETSSILVVGPDEDRVASAVDALRHADCNALGTSDPWEAMLLVSQRSFDLIVQDPEQEGFGASDFSAILDGDPERKGTPILLHAGEGGLVDVVRNTLSPRFPPEAPARSDTRFVRRRRPEPPPQRSLQESSPDRAPARVQ